MAVKAELKKMGLHFILVDLGEVEIMEDLSALQRDELKLAMLRIGLELMDDKRAILINKIKTAIIDMVHQAEGMTKITLSDYLSKKLNHEYNFLANLFSEVQGTNIEQYFISVKVELIKELIIYGELNITDIAYKLNYSSVAHLSNQFKKVTGLTPSHFKLLKEKRENPVEEVDARNDNTSLS
jgi:AraC-like DNA-binding protein